MITFTAPFWNDDYEDSCNRKVLALGTPAQVVRRRASKAGACEYLSYLE